MRYIAQYVRPSTGTTSPGTDNTLIREYANDRNALRYMPQHLKAPHFEAGQYEVRTFPPSDVYYKLGDRRVGYIYKRAQG